MASAPVAVDASDGSARPHEPTGYILSYGVSYKGVPSNGEALAELPACPPSATAAHDAFVSKCGFSSKFSPTLNAGVTKSRMVKDVRRVAKTVASHDVVVLYFSGHGKRMDDTECVIDSAGCVVSVRKLQAVFAEAVVERDVRDVAFVVILDCCQTLSSGKLLALATLYSWCGDIWVLPLCAGVADPGDDRNDLHFSVADADEFSWFVGFATSPGAFVGGGGSGGGGCAGLRADCAANGQARKRTRDRLVT